MKKIVKFSLIFGVLYYLFKDIEISNIIKALENYSIYWSIIVMFSVVVSDLFLSLRWRFLTKNKISLIGSFEAIGISAFLNFILPAKTGEISKILYLKKFYNFKATKATAVLLMERVFDVLLLAVMTMLTAFYLMKIDNALEYSIEIILIIVVALFLLKFKGIKKIIGFLPNQKLRLFAFRTFKHIFQINKKEDLIGNFIYSLFVWLSYFITVYIFLDFVAGFNLDLKEVFIVFVVSSIAMSIPLLPGGVGTYQAGVVFALGLYGIGKEDALLVGILIQLYNLVPSFLVAYYIMEKKGITIKGFSK